MEISLLSVKPCPPKLPPRRARPGFQSVSGRRTLSASLVRKLQEVSRTLDLPKHSSVQLFAVPRIQPPIRQGSFGRVFGRGGITR